MTSEQPLPDRTRIINWVIGEFGYRTYLEIGYGRGVNFSRVEIEAKTVVDPAKKDDPAVVRCTSNEFFESTDACFDLVFVDGLHIKEQFVQDVENSLRHLSPGGLILCHDVCGWVEIEQRVPRETAAWSGDCWRGWLELRRRADLEMWVINVESGLGVVRPGSQVPLALPDDISWEEFNQNRTEFLNLIEESDYQSRLARRVDSP